MKKVVLFIVLSHCFIFRAAAGDYLNYHRYINLAEYHLVHNQADSVFYYYDKAFGEFDFIFAKDALIAAQFAWKQVNREKTTAYLLKGARSGLRSKCLDVCPVMKSYTEARFYLPVYDSMRAANQRFEASLDDALRTEWASRFDEQMMTRAEGETGDFMSSVQRNIVRLKEFVSKGKFPGEIHTGLADDCSIIGSQNVFYVLVNYDCIITEMHEALWAAVKKGELHPREFASLWEWEFVRSAKKWSIANKKVFRTAGHQLALVCFKDNPYLVINRNCKKEDQQFRHFNLLLDLENIPSEELNKARAQYYITAIEVDEKKAQLEVTEGYRLFFGNK
jgi:hypothetical protein